MTENGASSPSDPPGAKLPGSGTRSRLDAAMLIATIAVLVSTIVFLNVMSQKRNERIYTLLCLARGLHGFEDAQGNFPESRQTHLESGAVTSWRVAILPYLPIEGTESLFQRYDSSRAWDEPSNAALLQEGVFHGGRSNRRLTYYLALLDEKGLWLSPFSNDHQRRDPIVAIEFSQSDVSWSEPRDLIFDGKAVYVVSAENHLRSVSIGGLYAVRRSGVFITIPDQLPDDDIVTVIYGGTSAP